MILRWGIVVLTLCCGMAGGGWAPERPGQTYSVSPSGLPAPAQGDDRDRPAPRELIWPTGVVPQVPKGFSISVFARLPQPNWMAIAPNGDVLVSQASSKSIVLLRDSDGKGRADQQYTFSAGYQSPHGLAVRGQWLYISDLRTVIRVPYTNGATRGGTPEKVIVAGGPPNDNALARDLAFDSQGNFYWGFASRSASDVSPDGTVQKVVHENSITTFASGMATVAGLAFYPGTDKLFAVVDERRGLGPGLVPDYLTHMELGAFYGWPYAFTGSHPDPEMKEQRPDLVAKSMIPDLLFEAGSTPLAFAFYDGRLFPRSYEGNAFVVLHGSWRQGEPVGYKVVHVPFHNGMPAGGYENFVTGFMTAGADGQPQMLGRPAGIAIAKDGSLLIADNIGGTIWRVAYTGK
jgi:glucose/arabinose dehydrogenase